MSDPADHNDRPQDYPRGRGPRPVVPSPEERKCPKCGGDSHGMFVGYPWPRQCYACKIAFQAPAKGSGEQPSKPDPRPANCRSRLIEQGDAYPRSGCEACGANLQSGLRCQWPTVSTDPNATPPAVRLRWEREGPDPDQFGYLGRSRCAVIFPSRDVPGEWRSSVIGTINGETDYHDTEAAARAAAEQAVAAWLDRAGLVQREGA